MTPSSELESAKTMSALVKSEEKWCPKLSFERSMRVWFKIVVMNKIINELPHSGEKLWFIIRSDAHEGPFSFDELINKFELHHLTLNDEVWARGWPEALSFEKLKSLYDLQNNKTKLPEEEVVIVMPPPESEVEEFEEPHKNENDGTPSVQEAEAYNSKSRSLIYVIALCMVFIGIGLFYISRPQKSLSRPQNLDLQAYRKMRSLFDQQTRSLPIPHVAISADYKKIWLLDKSNQSCTYFANFFSAADKNLSEKQISFSSEYKTQSHWIVFERFDFKEGQRLIPGTYEVSLQRQDCELKGIQKLYNQVHEPFFFSFSSDLFYGKPEDLMKRLKEIEIKNQKKSQQLMEDSIQYWREITEKLRTLKALSQQIEIDFKVLLNREMTWPNRVKRVVDAYTVRYGSFLSSFVDANEEDFNKISEKDVPLKIELMGRGPLITTLAKRIGFVSMELIEKLNAKDVPSRPELLKWLETTNRQLAQEKLKMDKALEEVDQYLNTYNES
jgi:hypothetical protein